MKRSRSGTEQISAGGAIQIFGASANNLKSLDVRIPLHAATLLVGVSGSGKSSLLTDVLAAEAGLRMRRFLGIAQDQTDVGDVPAFIGPLPACVHFAQGAFRASQRTTVATCSGLLTVIRRLFVKYAVPWADPPGEPVPTPSADSYAGWLGRHYHGRLTVWAVPLRFVASDGTRYVRKLAALGVDQITIRSETDTPEKWEKGRTVRLASFKPLSANVRHVIEAEIGSLELPADRGCLRELLARGFEAGDGTVMVELHAPLPGAPDLQTPEGTYLDSDRHFVHPAVTQVFAPPAPALLSFNAPSNERGGACPGCLGTGQALGVAEEALIAHPKRSMHGGAFSLWTEKNYKHVNVQHETIEGLRGVHGFDPDVSWEKLPAAARRLVLEGSGDTRITDRDRRTGRALSTPRRFEGFVPAILKRYGKTTAASARLESLVRRGPCAMCGGTRWSPQARALQVGGVGVAELLAAAFVNLALKTEKESPLEKAVPKEGRALIALLHHHAKSFESVGLGHLSGERGMLSLSEGESRRLRLAGLLNARGRNLALLLDEPARGLHEHDIHNLAESLIELKKSHTVVVNDHRFSIARAIDHVIELGPGAGDKGGMIVRAGSPEAVLTSGSTAQAGREPLPIGARHPYLEIRGASIHTLRKAVCRIPLGRLVCVTGVSGSGKSNFVRGILVPALAAELGDKVDLEGFAPREGSWKSVHGAQAIEEVLALEQRSPEPNRRSLVATYLDIAEPLRRLFAGTPEAGRLNLLATDFGLNRGRGRCPECAGLGQVEDRPSWVPCTRCGGQRFREEVLSIRLQGLNLAEVLAAPIEDLAQSSFDLGSRALDLFRLMIDLDLGYVSLGRRTDHLSGGEFQRLRIAHRLWKTKASGLLLVLDEPSAGLHPKDTARLLKVLDRIVAGGENTVVLVEHNVDLIRAADWILDFGPGGGPAGGRIVGEGPPDQIQQLDTPTGRAVAKANETMGPPSFRSGSTNRSAWLDSRLEPTVAGARAARSWLRVLLGHEVALPEEGQEAEGFQDLAVTLDEVDLAGRRPHEIGSLDLELGRWFLAPLEGRSTAGLDRMADEWSRTPGARLMIHPLLREMQVWGGRVPASDLKEMAARLKALRLEELIPPGRNGDLRPLRVGGKRFQPMNGTLEERRRILSDALSVGGGHVELRDTKGRLLDSLTTRHLDLERAAVAPIALCSVSLSRRHPLGCCPSCSGNGLVACLDGELIFQNRRAGLDSEALFRKEALAIFRGVRRNEMLPFFRRLEAEGLWPAGATLDTLDRSAREIFLFGDWRRQGSGSFLKDRNADPGEVSSWLRWNGVHRSLLGQLDRSRDATWSARVRQSASALTCTVCEGTGLAPQSRAVSRDGRSLHDWVLHGTVGELYSALQRSQSGSERESRMRERIVHCMKPMIADWGDAPLRAPLADPKVARRTFERVVHSFTLLDVVA